LAGMRYLTSPPSCARPTPSMSSEEFATPPTPPAWRNDVALGAPVCNGSCKKTKCKSCKLVFSENALRIRSHCLHRVGRNANLFKKYIEHLSTTNEFQQLMLFPIQAAQHWPLLTYQPGIARLCACDSGVGKLFAHSDEHCAPFITAIELVGCWCGSGHAVQDPPSLGCYSAAESR
jgi:hypothetical protein